MKHLMLSISILAGLLFCNHQHLFAQKNTAKTYKGVVNDDLPAMLTIKPTNKADEFELSVQVIGSDMTMTFKAVFADNYDKSRKRYFGDSLDGTGMFLYDVSSDAGKPEKNILSGYTYSSVDDYAMRKMIFFLEK